MFFYFLACTDLKSTFSNFHDVIWQRFWLLSYGTVICCSASKCFILAAVVHRADILLLLLMMKKAFFNDIHRTLSLWAVALLVMSPISCAAGHLIGAGHGALWHLLAGMTTTTESVLTDGPAAKVPPGAASLALLPLLRVTTLSSDTAIIVISLFILHLKSAPIVLGIGVVLLNDGTVWEEII